MCEVVGDLKDPRLFAEGQYLPQFIVIGQLIAYFGVGRITLYDEIHWLIEMGNSRQVQIAYVAQPAPVMLPTRDALLLQAVRGRRPSDHADGRVLSAIDPHDTGCGGHELSDKRSEPGGSL